MNSELDQQTYDLGIDRRVLDYVLNQLLFESDFDNVKDYKNDLKSSEEFIQYDFVTDNMILEFMYDMDLCKYVKGETYKQFKSKIIQQMIEHPPKNTKTKGDIIIQDIRIGDIHFEFQYNLCIKTIVETLPVWDGFNESWSWMSRSVTSDTLINYEQSHKTYGHGLNLYSTEVYKNCKFV